MKFHDFKISPADKVLDIGCGARPFAFATHLADVSLNDNSGRFDLPIPLLNRPFYECSVEEMPFDDAFFDFIYCSHVLEHVPDPAKACREIMRVGKRGYIECPRSWVEYVFESTDHKWFVDHEKNRLIFREKLDEERRDFLGIQYRIFDWIKEAKFRNYWNTPSIRAIRNVEFHWEGTFNYEIISKAERLDAGYRAHDKKSMMPKRLPRKTTEELRDFLYNELVQQFSDKPIQ